MRQKESIIRLTLTVTQMECWTLQKFRSMCDFHCNSFPLFCVVTMNNTPFHTVSFGKSASKNVRFKRLFIIGTKTCRWKGFFWEKKNGKIDRKKKVSMANCTWRKWASILRHSERSISRLPMRILAREWLCSCLITTLSYILHFPVCRGVSISIVCQSSLCLLLPQVVIYRCGQPV